MTIIAHLDMDAFFASVEERENPRWRGKPIVVGADPQGGKGRGVVATANYAARKYGIHSAMPIVRAWHLSEAAVKQGKPAALFLPGNFKLYRRVSAQVIDIVRRYAASMEQGSIDEAYFDLTSASPNTISGERVNDYKKAEQIARQIKAVVKAETGLTGSVGIGPNKLVAKIASGHDKPDGLTVVRPEAVLDFLAPLSVRELPGIGPKTGQRLAKKGIYYIHQLRASDVLDLKPLAYGIGSTELIGEWTPKSIGEQETFAGDSLRPRFLHERLAELAAQVFKRFQRSEFKSFRTVVLTVRFSDFQTQTRSHTLKYPASELKSLNLEIFKLLLPFFDRRANPKLKPLRLIGVRIEKLQ